MTRRRRTGALVWVRAVLGFVLAPTAVAVVFAAAAALGRLTGGSDREGTLYFLTAFAGYAGLHALRLLTLDRFYVFAHELTHALAAWATGGKVFAFVVRRRSGHVDLSHTSGFIALAPYWIPFYAVIVVAGYRFVLWTGPPAYARDIFLGLMGACLAFHFSHTVEVLWTSHQSDLNQLGFPLSMATIVFLNGIVLLGALKCLFPNLVSLAECGRQAATITVLFWQGAGRGIVRGSELLRGAAAR